MAEEMRGTPRLTDLVRRVDVLAWEGSTLEAPGTSSTSSNVYASAKDICLGSSSVGKSCGVMAYFYRPLKAQKQSFA
jgi:hypothetical protein|tara:strand:+ start:1338 stop:1568 length:231 start_codon:yes stop_codon:yes gene_type:complete